MATHYRIPAWDILMDRGAWWATVHGVTKKLEKLNDWAYMHKYMYVYIYIHVHTYVYTYMCVYIYTYI